MSWPRSFNEKPRHNLSWCPIAAAPPRCKTWRRPNRPVIHLTPVPVAGAGWEHKSLCRHKRGAFGGSTRHPDFWRDRTASPFVPSLVRTLRAQGHPNGRNRQTQRGWPRCPDRSGGAIPAHQFRIWKQLSGIQTRFERGENRWVAYMCTTRVIDCREIGRCRWNGRAAESWPGWRRARIA